MDILGTPEEYVEGSPEGCVATANAQKVLTAGLGGHWIRQYTFCGPTLDEKKAQEIVNWVKNRKRGR